MTLITRIREEKYLLRFPCQHVKEQVWLIMALFVVVLTRTIEGQNEDTNEVNMQKTHTLYCVQKGVH